MAGRLKVFELSDHELLIELKSRGLKHGPITKNTRRLFEKILTKSLRCDVSDKPQENDSCDVQDLGNDYNGLHCTNFPAECTNSISDRSIPSSLESPLIYYGVCFDADCSKLGSEMLTLPAVFSSKDEALKTAKKIKGARFKGFKTREEAELFSCSSLKEKDQSASPLSLLQSARDPGSTFKGPTPRELVKFRKIIEQAKTEEFLDVVLKNPRYLIAPGDTPVILQEGARYNALHVAAKSNGKEMCQLVIETLESDKFWKIYLSENFDSMTNAKRKQFLVDMYLNTPDSGCWETPLHFACKFGHVSVVEYLVSLPLTNLKRQNKDGKTPAQVICSRCLNESSKLRSQIIRFLEDNCFVPLLGSADNSTPPRIGNPWSPDVTDRSYVYDRGSKGGSLSGWQQISSPGEPAVTVRAYAGPMSPSKAAEFYHLWKTPPSNQERRNNYIQIKRKDNTRGVERIGRQLAHDRLIPWSEYWSFLGSYADLSCAEGLKKLEDYLAKKNHFASLNRSVTPQRIRALNSSVLRTPESRQSSVVVNLKSTPTQTQHSAPLCATDNMAMDSEENNGLSAKKALFIDSEAVSFGGDVVTQNAFHKRPVGLNHQNGDGSLLSGSSLQHITQTKALFKDSHLKVKTEIIGAEDVCDGTLLNTSGSADSNRQSDDEKLLSGPDSQKTVKTERLGAENAFRNAKQNEPGSLNRQSHDEKLLSGLDSQKTVKTGRLGAENVFRNAKQNDPGSANLNQPSDDTYLRLSGSSRCGCLVQDVQLGNSEGPAMETVTKTFEALSLHQSKDTKGSRRLSTDNSELTDSIDCSHSVEMADRSTREEQVENVLSCKKKLSFRLLESNESPLKDTYTKASGFDCMETPINKIEEAKNIISSSTTSESFGEGHIPLLDKKHLGGNLLQGKMSDIRSEIQRSVSHSLVTSPVDTLSSDFPRVSKKTANLPERKESLPIRSGSCSDVLGFGSKGPDDIFIQGSQPSKLDLDVLLAIGQAGIDPIQFPHIARWKKLVTSYSDATQLSWPSPGSPRYHLRQKSSLLWSC